jgi:hypothetical protein
VPFTFAGSPQLGLKLDVILSFNRLPDHTIHRVSSRAVHRQAFRPPPDPPRGCDCPYCPYCPSSLEKLDKLRSSKHGQWQGPPTEMDALRSVPTSL